MDTFCSTARLASEWRQYATADRDPAFGWRPLRDLVAFHDPLHPEFSDELHEWHFRSGLDRYIWIFGMACALGLPYLERRLGPTDGSNAKALHKAACDFFVWGATVNSLNLMLVPLLCGHGLEASLASAGRSLAVSLSASFTLVT